MKATITLAAALVLAGGASTSLAQAQLLNDGNFENLPAGSAPDCGIPAGAWHFVDGICEWSPQEIQIEASSDSTNGKVLAQQSGASEYIYLANTLLTPVGPNPGHILIVEFDILVDQLSTGGGSVFLFNHTFEADTDRGPQMTWRANGELTVARVAGTVLFYPPGEWQHLRLVLDMSESNYDLWWSLRGHTPVRYGARIQFRSAGLTHLTDFVFGRFGDPFLEFSSKFDNASAFEAPDLNGNRIPDYEECSADFNCDGDVGTDADIESFFTCLAGTCPAPPCAGSADYNHDGDIGTDADIESFFRVLGGSNC